MSYDLAKEIIELKKKTNTAILAHFYEDGDIQDVADFVGDSFQLAKHGQSLSNPTILMAGVVFMAESIKILNPTKKVIVPDVEAGCSLVQGSPYKKYLDWRRKYPDGIAVTYVNSSADVKTISDVIVTSSNAKKIIQSIPKDRPILFGPDENLGRFLAKESGREFILWPGSCEVHVLFSARRLFELVQKNPDAVVIAHPECTEDVLQYADVIGSTSKLLDEVKNNPAKKFIVATETGIFHQMKKLRSDVELIQAPTADETCLCNNCPYMKLNTLEKIKRALLSGGPEISVPAEIQKKALVPLDRMMKIAAAEGSSATVFWPESFLG